MRMRLERREPLPSWVLVLLPVAAILATLVLSAIPVALAGANVFEAYVALFQGALGSRFNLIETLVKTSPLVFTGLAVAFAFRAKFWNIGAEGQLIAGAIAGGVVGIHGGALPSFLLIPLMLGVGFLAGGLYACIPALLRTHLQVDDVVSSLLLNFVMIYLLSALLFGPLQRPDAGWPVSAEIAEAARYPVFLERTRLHLGIPLALAAVFVVWFLNQKTKFGYQARAVGSNLQAAHFAGIPTNRVIVLTALVSGGLAGIAGVGEVAAVQYKLLTGFSPDYGYTGIVIAMLGNLHPVGVALSALFFGIINVGSQTMSRMVDVPSYISGVMEGTALLVMMVFLLLKDFRLRIERR